MPVGVYKHFGHPQTLETRLKISKSKKGKSNTYLIGKTLSEETKNKIRLAHLGKKNKPTSLEGRNNLRKSRLKYYETHKSHMFGKKHTLEAREKIREYYKTHKYVYDKSKLRFGEKNNAWKGGVTPMNQKIRTSYNYILWRNSVYKRDDYTCQICGQRGRRLNANHIKRFSDYIELRTLLDNGITLCKSCHQMVTWHESEWESYFNFNLMSRGLDYLTLQKESEIILSEDRK